MGYLGYRGGEVRVRARAKCVRERVRLCLFSFVCLCSFVCVRVSMRARVHACTCACVGSYACVRVFPPGCVFALVCVASVFLRLAAARALPSHGRDVRF